jgi:predicted type IV restriction endonuclease
MAFHVGQKVVRITTGDWWIVVSQTGRDDRGGPRPKQIVAIASIIDGHGGTWLQFADWPTAAFDATEFSPVVEKPTSIAIFTAMLTPSPKQVELT